MDHLLIVEDNEVNRTLLKILLEVNGYRVTVAGNGLEALAAAKREPPDAIVSDVLMPKMDGFALCRAWMQDAALRRIPFIFYSGTYVHPDDDQFAMALGAVRYLIKPAEAEVFLRELREVLEQWAGREARSPTAPLDQVASHALHESALARKVEDKIAQLEAANRKLRESEARYRRIFTHPGPQYCDEPSNFEDKMMPIREQEIQRIKKDWTENPRWNGVKRGYTAEDVYRLRGSVMIEHTLAKRGAEKLWKMIAEMPFVNSLGAITGAQALQQVKAGVPAIYLSGWNIAADANDSLAMYPDQSLYAASSGPNAARRINNALARADQIQHMEGKGSIDYFAPIVADAEAGFGGVLNAFELMKSMIDAGVAGVHFEDQLASAKKCGHMGGKVLVPTREAEEKLIAARLAADVLGVPTLVLGRTDGLAANLLTSDVDERDKPFITGERTSEGFYRVKNSFEQALSRGLAYAEYADIVWCETGSPDLEFARKFAEGIRKKFPNKLLAYNCSPSFNWKRSLDDASIATFQRELGAMGYKFQFVTLASFHALTYSMFELAYGYARNNMTAFVELQEKEFAAEEKGFTAIKHQREVGTGYFDDVTQVIQGGKSSTTALHGSTENEQFFDAKPKAKRAA